MHLRTSTFAVIVASGLAVLQGAAVTKEQADSLAKKISLIEQHGAQPPKAGARRRTPVSESELNSWFAYNAPPLLPKGLTEPRLTIVDTRTVIGTAVVDLDA